MAKARSLNEVKLIGNLTRDPLLRKAESGVVVATFGVATNTSWKDAEGNAQERAEFHNIVAFNKLAEICAQVLATGMLVYIEGELRTRVKEGDDGQKIYKTEVKMNDMILLNSKDKAPVGLENAMEAGDDLQNKLGDRAKAPAENLEKQETKTEEEASKKAEESADDEVNAEDLF